MIEGLVSIIMPSWNTEKFIAETIQSVIDQTYKNWELIIADDCSPDDSGKIADKLASKDARIKVFHHGKNIMDRLFFNSRYKRGDVLIMIIKSTSRDTSCFGDIGYGDPVRSFLLYEFKKSSQDGFVRHRISFIRNWILHSRFPPISHKYSVTVQYPHSYGSKCLLNSYNIVQYNTDPEV